MRSDDEEAISSLGLTKGDLKETFALCGVAAVLGACTAITSTDTLGVMLGQAAIVIATVEAAVLTALYASDKKPGGLMNKICNRASKAYEYAVNKIRER